MSLPFAHPIQPHDGGPSHPSRLHKRQAADAFLIDLIGGIGDGLGCISSRRNPSQQRERECYKPMLTSAWLHIAMTFCITALRARLEPSSSVMTI